MTASEKFELIYAVIRGEITSGEANNLMGIPEQMPLVLEAG